MKRGAEGEQNQKIYYVVIVNMIETTTPQKI